MFFNARNTLTNGPLSVPQTCYGKASCVSPLHQMLVISYRNFFDGSLKTNGQYHVYTPLGSTDSEIWGDVHYLNRCPKNFFFENRHELCCFFP